MKYIFNADDFGRTYYTNKAISEGFTIGCLDRTTIMVNMDTSDSAVEIARKYGFSDRVGLHINLISGVPLTEQIKHCSSFCSDGRFNGKFFRAKRIRFFLTPFERKAVKKEIDAQIEKYIEYGFDLMHMDSHGHVHTAPSLFLLCIFEARRYDFKSIRISLNVSSKGIKKIFKIVANSFYRVFNKHNGKPCDYFDSLPTAMKTFQDYKEKPGVFEVMLHPDYRDRINLQLGGGEKYSDLYMFKRFR